MTAQEQFDAKYITSIELTKRLGIHRTTVLFAIRADRFPPPILITKSDGAAHLMLWERVDVDRHIDAWAESLAARKG